MGNVGAKFVSLTEETRKWETTTAKITKCIAYFISKYFIIDAMKFVEALLFAFRW